MILKRFGFTIHRASTTDSEIFFNIRNNREMRRRCVDKSLLTPENHKQWFSCMTGSPHNVAFVISKGSIPLGIAYGNLEYGKNNAVHKAGMLILTPLLSGRADAALASIAVYDMMMNLFEIDLWYGAVSKTNREALTFDLGLGYLITGEDSDKWNVMLTKEAYSKKTAQFRAYTSKLYQDNINCSWKDADLSDLSEDVFQLLYKPLTPDLSRKVETAWIKQRK